jgi:hypothetical protein
MEQGPTMYQNGHETIYAFPQHILFLQKKKTVAFSAQPFVFPCLPSSAYWWETAS